ncbi:mannose-1-phosphate guanyltransferase alpha-A-like [Clytia hemisphaerica]|uniref:Uncharacterized protein n=1 Tax=Clytia hemisphaerica TaxID=252671 RepID=A0A7M5UPP7_9CNID
MVDDKSTGKVKAVILVAGPQKGTRFRPLSLEVPKPLFPVAGKPLLEHHISSCCKLPDLEEIIILGFYQSNDTILRFIDDMKRQYKTSIRYLQEYQPLGTAGGLYHFRDQIVTANTKAIVVIHADIFCVLPLTKMMEMFSSKNENNAGSHIVLGTQVHQTSSNHSEHGNIVLDNNTFEVNHYVEKPESFVSAIINCGTYVFHPSVVESLGEVYRNTRDDGEQTSNRELLFFGKHLFTKMAGRGKLFCHLLKESFWGSMKSAGSAIYANRRYLDSYKTNDGQQLVQNEPGKPEIVGDVFIHPTATVHPTAKLGPNVSIGSNCVIGPGARVKESIILDGADLRENCCVLYSIIGWRCLVGAWSRIEGTPHEPNPNFAHALVTNESLFHADGHLIPSVTVLGCNVIIPREVIVLNCIVLPHKELSGSYKNQIIL